MVENDNNQEKALFNLYPLNSKYDEIAYCIWKIPYEFLNDAWFRV